MFPDAAGALEETVRAYVNYYGWTDMTNEEIVQEILADAYAGIDIFLGRDYYEGATKFTEAVRGAVKAREGEEQKERGPPEGEKYSPKKFQSYEISEEFARMVPPKERAAFLRSLANKTVGIKHGKPRTIAISTADHVYWFTADDYMSGQIERKIDLNNSRIIAADAWEDYYAAHNDTKTADLWAKAVSDQKRKSKGNLPIPVRGRSENAGADRLSGGKSGRNGAGSNVRSDEDYEGEVDAQIPGSVVFDGENGYAVNEDGSLTQFSMKAPVEETDRIIALHNMSPEVVRGAGTGAGTEGKASRDAKKWQPKLTESEWNLAKRVIDNYEGENYNDGARYALKSEKGSTVFVIYSTTEDDTMLFAMGGEKAEFANDFTMLWKEGEIGFDKATRSLDPYAKKSGRPVFAGAGNNAQSRNGGGATGTGTVYPGQSGSQTQRGGYSGKGRRNTEYGALISTLHNLDEQAVR